jgi:hypothetical protein
MNSKLSRLYILIGCQALLCSLEAYLISRISLIGKIGIAIFYKEYAILRSGLKTYFLFFGMQLLVIIILYIIKQKYSVRVTRIAGSMLIVAALIGLLTTYNDFQGIYFHRLLKERFHIGFYLFWIGWIGSCIFFMINGNEKKEAVIENQPDTFV